MSNNFRKIKPTVVAQILNKQHPESKQKLIVGYNKSSPHLINAATLGGKIKRSPSLKQQQRISHKKPVC